MKIRKIVNFLSFVAISYASMNAHAAEPSQTLLLRQPTLSETHLAFVYAGDIWVSQPDGSHPRRLTSHPATETHPVFSPDGKFIAFSANYENNWDVYVIPTAGGQPTRLTWHPYSDQPLEWSKDGASIIFTSARETDHGRSRKLYQVPATGGAPEKLMDARITQGTFHPHTGELAYIPFNAAYNGLFGGTSGWKGYRGGTVPEIWILNASQSELTTIPGEDASNFNPMWINNDLYFISDRDEKLFKLHKYNPKTKKTEQVTDQPTWDIRNASAYQNSIVYECGGRIYRFDTQNNQSSEIKISIAPDLPQLRKQWKQAGANITEFELSKSGKRALITARGDVFSVPVKDGSTRNLSKSTDQHDYSARWAPDASEIAWVTEADFKQKVVFTDQFGKETRPAIELGSYFYNLITWVDSESPKLVYADNHLGLHLLDLNSRKSTRIATSARRAWSAVAVSPDASWLAYTLQQPNFNSDLILYNIETQTSHTISDGMADVGSVDFSADGKYLYFTASVNSGPVAVGLNMTSQEHPLRSGLYATILAAEDQSPLLPKTGDEALEDVTEDEDEATHSKSENHKEEGDKDKEAPRTVVDLEGIQSRIIALPVAERQIGNVGVDKDGNVFYVEYTQPGIAHTPPGELMSANNRLMRFDIEEKEETEVMKEINGFTMNAERSHLLIQKTDRSLATAEVGKSLEPEPVHTDDCKMLIEPRVEWLQIFNDVWRMEQEYFYASNLHGLDWEAVYRQYRPLVDHVGRREDLNELMVEMIAELNAGHNRVGGGDTHQESGPEIGLLGCNLEINNDRYQVTKVYHAAPWNPFLKAPLTIPGQTIEQGEYILSINGDALTAKTNIFQFLQGTVGKQVTLTVADNADGDDSRQVIIEPVSEDDSLRLWDWVETNRAYVNEATDGKVGYIYLPNTAGDGYHFFNRMFFAQINKKALIIDERSNGGGQAADYIIETLARKHLSGWADRDGLIYNTPNGALHGPKLMMIDQDAGSGGDYLPYMFSYTGTGKLLGTRTWGGLIGIATNPPLVDGGFVLVPFFRFFDANSEWRVENEGVAPDIEVPLCPIATNNGKDSQLDAAIEAILEQLNTFKSTVPEIAPALPTELGK